jgi:hypothetical protein
MERATGTFHLWPSHYLWPTANLAIAQVHHALLRKIYPLQDNPPIPIKEQYVIVSHFHRALSSLASEPVRFPGLYEANSQIHFTQAALEDSMALYPEHFNPPPFPIHPPLSDHMCAGILESLQMTVTPIPIPDPASEAAFSAAALQLKPLLLSWIREVLAALKTDSSIDRMQIPQDLAVILMRTIWFLCQQEDVQPLAAKLFGEASVTFALIAVHRYSKSVLCKIASDLVLESANRNQAYRQLVAKVQKVTYLWQRFSALQLPIVIKSVSSIAPIFRTQIQQPAGWRSRPLCRRIRKERHT